MAKKKINKSDIAPIDIFENVTEGAKQAKIQIDLLTKSVNALKTNAKNIKSVMPKSAPSSTKGMKDFNQLQVRANATAKAKLQIDKQLLHHKAKLSQIQRDENKAIKTTIEAQSKLSKTQTKNLGTLQKLAIANRKLRAERAKLNLDTKKGTQALKVINTQLDKNNLRIRESGDAMKKQRLNVGNYGGAIGKLTGLMARLGVGFAVFRLLKGTFSIVKDFEQSQANLASVLGVNIDEMGALTEQAKRLGATTTFTASQVAELHLELAKLGFKEDIEGMTQSILELAEATGTDLGESASVVGATMRGFGLDVSQTKRVTDVMAKAFTSSSLDMEKFSNSMAKVAPVAQLADVSLERTTAMLGTLTDRGLEASTAGTGLRNMFLKSNKAGLTFAEAMDKIRNATDQSKEAMRLFGVRGTTVGVILANSQQGIDDLTISLLQSEDSAKKMADTQRNTLGGSIKLLTSAWEGLVLKFEEGTGTFGLLKDAIAFLAENLEVIIKLFVVLGTAFGVYTLIDKTVKSFKALNLVMKANPYILIASSIMAVVVALKLFSEKMSTAEKIQENFNNLTISAESSIQKEKVALGSLVRIANDKTFSDERRLKAIQDINAISPEMLGNITLENIGTEQGITAINNYTGALKRQAMQKAIANKMVQVSNLLLEEETKNVLDNVGAFQKFMLWGGTAVDEETGKRESRTLLLARKRRKENIAGLTAELDALKDKSDAVDRDIENKKITSEIAETPEEIKKRLEAEAYALKKISSLKLKIQAQETDLLKKGAVRDKKARQDKFDNDVSSIRKLKTNKTEYDTWLKNEEKLLVADLLEIQKKFENDKYKLKQEAKILIINGDIALREEELKGMEDTFENFKETEVIRKEIYRRRVAEIEASTKKETKGLAEGSDKRLLIETKARIKIKDLTIAESKRLEQYNSEARARMDKEFTNAENKKLLTLLESSKSQKEIDEEMLDFQIEQLTKKIEDYKKLYPLLTEEITKMEIDLANKKRTLNDKELKETEEGIKEMQELRNTAIEVMTDLFVKKTDERIAKLDEEISAHQKQADFLKQLAINGNINAKDSLAEENRLIAESEVKKEQAEKKKQRMLMVSAILKAYIANLDADQNSGTALANAITSKAVLDQFVAGIGSFYEGTEDTGTVSSPLDSNGGRMAILHNNERVLTSKQNKKIGGYSNEQVASIVEQNRLGNLADNTQIGGNWESQLVVNELLKVGDKLDAVNKTIADKEVSSVELGAITQSTMNIVESRKKAGNRTISTYKVKI